MAALLIGYARVSTEERDLTAQHDALEALGVGPSRIYVDHGLTGTNRERPGLREAMAACREGDTLVVTKLDRLARSLPDARAILEKLTARHPCEAPPRWGGPRPRRPSRPTAVQRARDGRGVRVTPDPAAHPRGHAGRPGERPTARQATQAQPEARGSPGVLGAQRRVQHPRSGRTVRRWPLHGLPRR